MNPAHATKILVVDDDESVRNTLRDILELNGYAVVTADDGVKGLAAARSEQPSLVITDVAMPGMDGYELLKALRADPDLRMLPVIVISAKAERAAMRRGMELAASDFITKPFTEEEVVHSVAARLEQMELVDEINAFAHTVAHDLKGPLASLYMRLDLATMMLNEGDEKNVRIHLAESTKAAARLSRIIDELLILAGVRKAMVAPGPLDMPAIVTEAVERLESILKKNAVRVQVAKTFPMAIGYAPWVVEIFANYISNAAKYGGDQPEVLVGGEVVGDGSAARFWVQDKGPGLDEEAKARMFVPFTRISSVRAEGHGLGLSIVRRIAEKLGGQVGVESSPGTGSRFWFELPTRVPTA